MSWQLAFADESIHDGAGVIVTAIVFPDSSIEDDVDLALTRAGLEPGVDEFKSSAKMSGHPKLQALRNDVKGILRESSCKFAIIVSDRSERNEIAMHITRLLEAMILRGRFKSSRLDLSLDKGMRTNHAAAEWRGNTVLRASRLRVGQDSCTVRGLQLADMVAHSAAMILLSDMGQVRKAFPAGFGTPFDPDQLIELEYGLWTDLRYGFASDELAFPELGREPTSFAFHDAYGLFVSDKCSAAARRAALDRFAAIWLGCIV